MIYYYNNKKHKHPMQCVYSICFLYFVAAATAVNFFFLFADFVLVNKSEQTN